MASATIALLRQLHVEIRLALQCSGSLLCESRSAAKNNERAPWTNIVRLSEVVLVKVPDIDFVKRLVRIACGKGGHKRVVFLPSSMLEGLSD